MARHLDGEKDYDLGFLPEVTVTANAPTVYWDGFNYIGFDKNGKRKTKGSNFNPQGAHIISNPQQFEKLRLVQAKKADVNHTHEFAEQIRGLAEALVTAPAGDVLAEPINRGLGFIGKIFAKSKLGKNFINRFRQSKLGFKSELDWSTKSWFEDAANRRYNDKSLLEYTDDDIKQLASHIKEYHDIERRTKKNGTWLKMSDGSIYAGDPREWVMLNSNAAKSYNKDVFWSGRQHYLDPNYIGELWGVRGKGKYPSYKARSYASTDKLVHPFISENAPVKTFDAKGNSWFDLFGTRRNNPTKPTVKTNDYVNYANSKGYPRVHIDNVVDPGQEFIPTTSKYSFGDRMIDYDLQLLPQDDVIIQNGTIRKTLRGNNGDLNPLNKNIFRAVLPLLIGEESIRRSLKSGGSIYIKPENLGKFNATKEHTGKTTEELTHSKNPLTRKRAIFAQNATKWKH